jgi:large subunit ribosomal protein L7/L12
MNNHALSKLEKLKLQQEKLKAQIQKAEALEKNKNRKQDTRRKILIGSYFLDHAMQTGTFDDLKKKMAEFLTRDADRALFDLPVLENETIKQH